MRQWRRRAGCGQRNGRSPGGNTVTRRLAVLKVFAVQHIGELLKISHNDDILGAGEGQHAGGQIHLRSLIHDKIIVDMFKV